MTLETSAISMSGIRKADTSGPSNGAMADLRR